MREGHTSPLLLGLFPRKLGLQFVQYVIYQGYLVQNVYT